MDRRQFLLACAGSVVTGCGSPPTFENPHGSAEALAIAVLDALAVGDRVRLEQLAVSEREFRDLVWPDLPSSRPERNLPFSYVWGDLHQKSTSSLLEVLRRHGGRRYGLRRVSFGAQTAYDHYVVHREATFHVIDEAQAELPIRVCGSFLQWGSAWKVFSYVIDD